MNLQDPRDIDPALRAKYDVRGPRYTSYPPATHFAEIDREELFARWRARNALASDPGLSLYFHIPFCRSRCLFCGCHTTITSNQQATGAYTQDLLTEMALAQALVDPKRRVHQLAMGGGTPNHLSEEQLATLLGTIKERFTFAADAEISVEIDPRTATQQKLDLFLQHGFNRFSLGIQDLEPRVMEIVRRGQDLMQVEDVITYLRKAGVRAINFDLIYGLPHQTKDTARRTAAQVIQSRPSRIALYSYAHVPWMQAHQQALERHGLPGTEEKAALFFTMMDAFLEAGYQAIGMDHFALPEDALAVALKTRTLRRNFMGYTTGRGLDLLGFGASGISSIGASYAQNQKDNKDYHAALAQGDLPVFRGFLLSQDDEIRRELILELFCNFYADLDRLSQEFGIDAPSYLRADLDRLAAMEQDGLVQLDGRSIEVTGQGRFFIRNICMQFDRYLEQDPDKRMYSRTI